jgi:uncharacterized membrane protein YgcG
VGASGASNLPKGLSASERRQIASEIHNAGIDVWTGVADKTLRRLNLGLVINPAGRAAALLGPRATLALTMQYANLNQPQAISAPTTVLPYGQFQAKLKVLLADLQSGLSASSSGGASSGGSSSGGSSSGGGTATGPTGASSSYQRYANCIQSAGADIAKMQTCAPLLSSK